jgi:hypothetical protein
MAAGLYPSPVQIADVTTTTTHKTLRGPRGGLILAKANPELEKKLSSLVFPGTQGGPLMHVIAAKAVAFKEAMEPAFKDYQAQVIKNAQTLAAALVKLGFNPEAAAAQVKAVRAAVAVGRKKAVSPLAADVLKSPHHLEGVQPHATRTHPLTGEQMPNPYHEAFHQELAQGRGVPKPTAAARPGAAAPPPVPRRAVA